MISVLSLSERYHECHSFAAVTRDIYYRPYKVINLYQPRALNDNLYLAERTRVELNFEGRGFETMPQTEIFACSAVWTNSFKNISCYDYRVDNITTSY